MDLLCYLLIIAGFITVIIVCYVLLPPAYEVFGFITKEKFYAIKSGVWPNTQALRNYEANTYEEYKKEVQEKLSLHTVKSNQSKYNRGLDVGKVDCRKEIMGKMYLPDAVLRGSKNINNTLFQAGYLEGYKSCPKPAISLEKLSSFINVDFLIPKLGGVLG